MQRSLGVPRNLNFANLEAQADEFGYFSLDPRVFGNQETADTLPIIQWMSPAFSTAAQVVRDIPAKKWQGGDTFMKVFSTFLDDGGKAYYNVTEPGPVGKVVKGIGDLQRHVQAEMVLNLNPGNWIGNWVGAWATGAYEGYGSLKTTGEFIDQMYKIFNAAPTERIRDSLEGRPTGSRAHLVWSESKLFRPAAWLQGIEPAVEYFASAQSKHAVRDWFQRAEKVADTWNPLTPFAMLSDTTNRLVDDDDASAVYGQACRLWRGGQLHAHVSARRRRMRSGRNMAHAFDQTLMTHDGRRCAVAVAGGPGGGQRHYGHGADDGRGYDEPLRTSRRSCRRLSATCRILTSRRACRPMSAICSCTTLTPTCLPRCARASRAPTT